MTRVTSFGLKRTYLEAGFSNDETPSKETALIVPGGEQTSTGIHDPTASSEAAPPKKKRKRTPKSKRDGNLTKNAAESKGEAGKDLKGDVKVESVTTVPATGKSAKRNKRNKERRKSKSFAKHS
jgi:zinc finger CCHC domain-containing protein 9